MAKRKTPKVDLTKKITKEELEGVQESINKINQIKIQIADAEVRKGMLLGAFSEEQQKMSLINQDLQEKYGDVNINVQTGAITEKSDEQSNS
tara:strand:+ start:658 stop:933 length:276 start_codon:yes stop_codon:yes gene_type:complete